MDLLALRILCYLNQGKSMPDIALIFDCTRNHLYRYIEKYPTLKKKALANGKKAKEKAKKTWARNLSFTSKIESKRFNYD
jgi:hypothetical protein